MKKNSKNELNVNVTKEQGQPKETIKIGGATFEVIGYFDDTSKNGVYNKMLRLIQDGKINHVDND